MSLEIVRSDATEPGPLRVAVAGECDLVVHGLRHMLEPFADRVVLLDAAGSASAETPDLVLHDPLGPNDDPLLARWTARVVAYTWDVDAARLTAVHARSTTSVLSKLLPASDLVEALERIHLGNHVVAPETPLVGSEGPPNGWEPGWRDDERVAQSPLLSSRESEILSLVASGVSNQDIADRIYLSMNTVKSHIRTAYRKIGVETRGQAILWAVDHGLRRRGLAERTRPSPVARRSSDAAGAQR